jgi:hypothetical protein
MKISPCRGGPKYEQEGSREHKSAKAQRTLRQPADQRPPTDSRGIPSRLCARRTPKTAEHQHAQGIDALLLQPSIILRNDDHLSKSPRRDALLTRPEQSRPNEGIRLGLSPRRLPGLLRLGFILRRAHIGQDLDQEAPGLVALNPPASEILAKAHMLAEDEREDLEAISELRALSRSDPRPLREAALGARQRGQHQESSWADLTHRLIQAAINNTPIIRLNDEDRNRLKSFDDFANMPMDAKWDTLTNLEPRLLELADDARAGKLGSRTQQEELQTPSADQQQQAKMIGRRHLNDCLVSVIGPQARTKDPLTQSRLAFNAARRYLLSITES